MTITIKPGLASITASQSIFNVGHGIVPNTPVDAVLQVVHQIKSVK